MIEIAQLAGIRKAVEYVVSTVASEDLFKIPRGFANHIAWNAAHIVVTQQSLHYRLSGLQTHLPGELVNKYRKGTGPEDGDEASYRQVMEFLHQGPELLAADYRGRRFEGFMTYETSAGIPLENIDDAIAFNNFHEGIHLGYILALKKAVARD